MVIFSLITSGPEAVNRTMMELKYKKAVPGKIRSDAVNRTMMELKCIEVIAAGQTPLC